MFSYFLVFYYLSSPTFTHKKSDRLRGTVIQFTEQINSNFEKNHTYKT